MITTIIILGWLLSGALAYTGTVAYFRKEFLTGDNYRMDIGLGVFLGLLGPLGLLVVTLESDFFKHGLMWR